MDGWDLLYVIYIKHILFINTIIYLSTSKDKKFWIKKFSAIHEEFVLCKYSTVNRYYGDKNCGFGLRKPDTHNNS